MDSGSLGGGAGFVLLFFTFFSTSLPVTSAKRFGLPCPANHQYPVAHTDAPQSPGVCLKKQFWQASRVCIDFVTCLYGGIFGAHIGQGPT
jgi:hypothetical protein